MTEEIQTTEAPETVDAAVEVSPSDTPEVVSDDDAYGAIYDKLVTNNGAERGDDGKFKSPKAESVDSSAPVDGSPGGEEGAEADAPDESASVAAQAPSAPSHLPDPVKQAWDKLPEEARTAFAEFTSQQDKKFAEIGRELSRYKPVLICESGQFW